MNRRDVITGLGAAGAALPLAACGGDSATIRFRVIATAEVDGERVEGSSVMEVSWTAPASKYSIKFWGEAFPLELKGRGTVFVLHQRDDSYEQDGGAIGDFYSAFLPHFAGVMNGGVGAYTPEDYVLLRNAKGKKSYSEVWPRKKLPYFIAFKDEAQPKSVYQVDPLNLEASFGQGVKFIGLDIEITKAPLTKVIKQRLKWLNLFPGNPIFDDPPPGQSRPLRELPLSQRLGYYHFIREGSF